MQREPPPPPHFARKLSWVPPPPTPPTHAFVVACLSSQRPPQPFLFRNYDHAVGVASRYEGTSGAPAWQASATHGDMTARCVV